MSLSWEFLAVIASCGWLLTTLGWARYVYLYQQSLVRRDVLVEILRFLGRL